MLRWGGIAGAALVLALAQIGLGRSVAAVAHQAVLLDPGVPATVYLPAAVASGATPRPAAVVVLAHGWGANRGTLRALARDLASAGYAAIAVDLAGHGASPRRFAEGAEARRALGTDIAAAVLYARTRPGLDGQRVAVLGHGLGADAALEYASQEPAVSAVIALSPGEAWSGGYTPPNALLIWGEDQRAGAVGAGREIGERLVGIQQIRVGRTYGEFERGTAVRTLELENQGYLGLPYSREVHGEVRAWLAQAFGPGPGADPAPGGSGALERAPVEAAAEPAGRAPGLALWSGLALLAGAALFALLAGLAPRAAEGPAGGSLAERLLPLAAALALGVLFAGGADPAEGRGPFAFFPFPGGRALLGVLAIAGAVLAVVASLRAQWRAPAVPALLAAGALAALLYATLGFAIEPAFDPWLGSARLGWALLAAALVLPYFALGEAWLRGAGAIGWILPGLSKLVLFGALVAASWLQWLPDVWLVVAPVLGALLGLLELAALRLHQGSAGPWLAGLLQSLAVGWFLTATFPHGG